MATPRAALLVYINGGNVVTFCVNVWGDTLHENGTATAACWRGQHINNIYVSREILFYVILLTSYISKLKHVQRMYKYVILFPLLSDIRERVIVLSFRDIARLSFLQN